MYIIDQKVIPVLDIDPQQGLAGEAELSELEVIQVPAADSRHVVPVVAVLGEGGPHVEDVIRVPGVVLLRPYEAEGGGGLRVGRHGLEELLGVGRDVGEGVLGAGALAHRAAHQQLVSLGVNDEHLQTGDKSKHIRTLQLI